MRITGRLWILLAGLLMACDLVGAQPDSQEPTAPAETTLPAVTPEPPAAPIVRAPTTAELLRSCPLEAVSFAELHKRLAQREFAKLDATLSTLHDGARKTPACESHLWDAVGFLSGVEPALLDRWAAARPDSWGAFTARGLRWIDAGYASRGTAYSKDVTDAQWAGMRDAFARAEADLTRALEIEPNGYVAYGYAIHMLRAAGNPDQIRSWLEALLARDPYNYGVRRRAMLSLSPHWGGSLEAMSRIAEEAQRFADVNPRLRILPAFVEAELGANDWRAQRYKEAARGYRRALAYGGVAEWYDRLADCQSRMDLWVKVVETSDTWIAELGDDAWPRKWRGRARTQLGDLAGALADLDAAQAGEPRDAYTLRLRAQARRLAGKPREAADDLRRSLELEPDNAWAIELLDTLESGAARTARSDGKTPGATPAAQPQAERQLPGLARLGLAPAKQ